METVTFNLKEVKKAITVSGGAAGSKAAYLATGSGMHFTGGASAVRKSPAILALTSGKDVTVGTTTKDDAFERYCGGDSSWQRDFDEAEYWKKQAGRPTSPLCGGIRLSSSPLRHNTDTDTAGTADAPLNTRRFLVMSGFSQFPVGFPNHVHPPVLAKLGPLAFVVRKSTGKRVGRKNEVVGPNSFAYPTRLDWYEGEVLVNDEGKRVPHGKGQCKYREGARLGFVYVGEWDNGLRNGKGTMMYPDGNKYEGYFEDNYICGNGIYTWADGRRYEGLFREGRMHGCGLLTDGKGNSYEGYFENNTLKHGRWNGVNGEIYQGGFENGMMGGKGMLTDSVGNKYEGYFENNEMVRGWWTQAGGETLRITRGI